MTRLFQLAGIASACLFLSNAAWSEDLPVKKSDGVLVSSSGMSVYTFDKDSDGKSACSGQCVKLWPPVTVSSTPTTKPWSAIKRDDGSMQLTYNGKPLYLYSGDHKPGDRNGDNFKDIWHLAKD
jgi:predicted lipoprotein with Yx(FWY)xxD motif